MPAQRAHSMQVLGPLIDLEKKDTFVWLRAFPSLEERDRMKEAFYESPIWKNELEAIAMPMLEEYSVVLTETTDRFFNFDSQNLWATSPDAAALARRS